MVNNTITLIYVKGQLVFNFPTKVISISNLTYSMSNVNLVICQKGQANHVLVANKLLKVHQNKSNISNNLNIEYKASLVLNLRT